MRILCLGLLQDGGCRGVGVFREEIRVSGECPYAGGVGIRSDTACRTTSPPIWPRGLMAKATTRTEIDFVDREASGWSTGSI